MSASASRDLLALVVEGVVELRALRLRVAEDDRHPRGLGKAIGDILDLVMTIRDHLHTPVDHISQKASLLENISRKNAIAPDTHQNRQCRDTMDNF